MLTEDRLKEIRERAEREDYHCREHFASFDADQDVLDLLADRATLTAEHERLKAEKSTFTTPEAAVLCAWLKSECEAQNARADKAEAERDALAARLSALEQAVREYLDWGAMTGSDRDLFEDKFRAALTPPKTGDMEESLDK